jgi:hypothetical protein
VNKPESYLLLTCEHQACVAKVIDRVVQSTKYRALRHSCGRGPESSRPPSGLFPDSLSNGRRARAAIRLAARKAKAVGCVNQCKGEHDLKHACLQAHQHREAVAAAAPGHEQQRKGEHPSYAHVAAGANHPDAASKINLMPPKNGRSATMDMQEMVRDMRNHFCEPCGADRGTKAPPW